jgi:ribosome biogenesis GTPase
MKIKDLGYGEFFESSRVKLDLGGFLVARVVAEYREVYRVKNERGEFLAKITGKQIFDAQSREDYPAVGDWAAITELGGEQVIIHKVLPRKTIIKRKYGGKNETQVIAANIDAAFIVQALEGDYSLNRFERYFALCTAGGVGAAAVLNKADLISKEELGAKIEAVKKRFGDIEIIVTNAVADNGLDELKARIEKNKTYCFLGSSGVGKSTIINGILGERAIETGRIDIRTGRGRHTTTMRQMFFLENGGIVIDNPGMREVGMADSGRGVEDVFGKIANLAKNCKFGDCRHENEPDCAVRRAIEAGEIDAGQFKNYLNLKKETEFFELDKIGRRQKDRNFGKFIKTAKKQLEKMDF